MTTIALGQFVADSDRAHNLAEIERLIAQAADEGSEIICFHELATSIYFCFRNDPAFFELAEPADGYSVSRVREAARTNGIAVIFPFYELADNGERYNSALAVDKNGTVIGKYRKMSIPQILQTVGPDETSADERFYFRPGNLGFRVFDVAGIRVGILICYDRHFPEAARAIGLQGADVLFVPTATYRSWIRDVWETELAAHAIANGYYVAGVNRVGRERGGVPGRHYFGSSFVVDPKGQFIARAGDQTSELLRAEISPQYVRETRSLWGFFESRRADAYGLLTDVELVGAASGASVTPEKGN